LAGFDEAPFLKMGMIIALFHADGILPLIKWMRITIQEDPRMLIPTALPRTFRVAGHLRFKPLYHFMNLFGSELNSI